VIRAGQPQRVNAGNSDRLLFGATLSNYSATWATAMGNIDTTADKCDIGKMSLMKRIAKLADPHVRPFKSKVGQEFFVAFHGSRTFRDLKADTTFSLRTAMRGLVTWKRIRSSRTAISSTTVLSTAKCRRSMRSRRTRAAPTASTLLARLRATFGPVILCGAQAVGIAWGQEPTPRTDNVKDYGFPSGVAIEELLGVKKLCYNGKMQGMVQGFFAAAADS
jgi:hypothetical protein